MVRVRQVLERSSVLWAILLACLADAQPPEENWTFNVDRATQEVESGHCVAHEFNVPGQGVHLSGSGVHLSGSVGGMMLGPITYRDSEDSSTSVTLTPMDVRTVVNETSGPAESAFLDQAILRDVLLVVADDFAQGRYTVPEEAYSLTADEADRERLAAMVENGDFSHGALVMHHLNALIAATSRFNLVREELPDPKQQDDALPIYIWERSDPDGPGKIIVGPLNMSSLQAGSASEIDVQAVLNALNGSLGQMIGDVAARFSPDLEDVFVNFSWVFLPCESVRAFLADPRGFASYDQYLESIGLLDETVDLSQLMRYLGSENSQLLNGYFQGGEKFEVPVQRIMFAAAAGNFAREYQMLPAGWRYVVGASVAEVPDRDLPGRYANAGDVTVAGEWIALQELSEAGELMSATELSYAGTSFAAPLVTLYSALDLVGEERCSGFDSSNPALGGQPSRLITASEPKDAFSDPGDVWLPDAIDDCM